MAKVREDENDGKSPVEIFPDSGEMAIFPDIPDIKAEPEDCEMAEAELPVPYQGSDTGWVKREPFTINTDSESDDNSKMDTYEQLVETSIENEISKISNNHMSDVDESDLLHNELFHDESSTNAEERIIDDARILAESTENGDKQFCRFCSREISRNKQIYFHERVCKMRPKGIPVGPFYNGRKYDTTQIKTEPTEPKVCRVCSGSFPNSSSLRQHMKLVHIEMVQTGAIEISPEKGRSLRRRNDSANSGSPDENSSPIVKRERRPNSRFSPSNSPKAASTPCRNSTPNQKVTCDQCGVTLANKYILKNHVKVVHAASPRDPSQRPWLCPICPNSFKTKAHLKTHLINLHAWTKDEFKSTFPDERLNKSGNLGNSHLLPNERLSKSFCGSGRPVGRPSKKSQARFEELFVLKRRFSDESDENQKENSNITCQVCGKEFEDQEEFTKHVQKKHRAKFRRSVHSEDLQFNVKERRRSCPLTRVDSVGDKFDSGTGSDSSSTCSGGECCRECFPCQFCGRSFKTKANRIVHERMHTGEKPFQCSVCWQSFACFTYLQSHLEMAHNLLKG